MFNRLKNIAPPIWWLVAQRRWRIRTVRDRFTHEIDSLGYATDPQLRELETQLGRLRVAWFQAEGDDQRQAELVQEYHGVMEKLYAGGWNGLLDPEFEFSEDLMPERYLREKKRLLQGD